MKFNLSMAALTLSIISVIAPSSVKAVTFNLNTGINSNFYSISGAATVASGLNLTTPNGAYLANNAAGTNSRWIGPIADASNNAPVGDYTYATTFNLTGLDRFSTTVSTLRIASDNLFTRVRLNGINILIPIVPSNFAGFTDYNLSQTLFRTASSSGVNTLDFTVNNAGGSPNPTGFRSEFSLDVQPVPYEFETAAGLVVFGGYFAAKRYLKKRKSAN